MRGVARPASVYKKGKEHCCPWMEEEEEEEEKEEEKEEEEVETQGWFAEAWSAGWLQPWQQWAPDPMSILQTTGPLDLWGQQPRTGSIRQHCKHCMTLLYHPVALLALAASCYWPWQHTAAGFGSIPLLALAAFCKWPWQHSISQQVLPQPRQQHVA